MCWTTDRRFWEILYSLWQRLRRRRRDSHQPEVGDKESEAVVAETGGGPVVAETGGGPVGAETGGGPVVAETGGGPVVPETKEGPFVTETGGGSVVPETREGPFVAETRGEPVVPEVGAHPVMGEGKYFCLPCGGYGKRVDAEGFCVDCSEYLCKDCIKYHKILTATKNHELLNKEEMTVDQPKTVKDRPTQICQQHEDEIVKYYCPQHDCVGCHACITLYHRTCKGVVYIQEVSKAVTESKEFKDFATELQGITKKATDLDSQIKTNVELVENCDSNAIVTLREVRKKLNDDLDKLEKDLKEKIEQMAGDEKGKMKDVSEKLKEVQSEIKALTDQIEKFKSSKENCNLFMMMKETKRGVLKSLEDKLNKVNETKAVKLFSFQPNITLIQMLKEMNGLGEMRLKIQTLEHVTDINMRSEDDGSECSITGSAMMYNDRLVVTDYWNWKIKLIDVQENCVKSELVLTSAPWDCTNVGRKEVAVSLPSEKKVVLVKTDPKLKVRRNIEMDGECRGVAHNNGQLIVTFPQQNAVKLMDMDGIVAKTIPTDDSGQVLFDNPSYVTIRPENNTIYVSNWNNNTVVYLTTEGQVINTFTDEALKCPEQVIVDATGMVYCCGCISHNIFQMTADCQKGKIILKESQGLRNPYSINYSDKMDRFYVGMRGVDHVKVYQAF